MTEAEQVILPDGKETFKLSEVCKLAKVQPYMLRYWGSEFADLEAQKSATGQRTYSREQVELILEIRHLLFDEGLTIAGVRKRITGRDKPKPAPAQEEPAAEKKKPAKRARAKKPAARAKQPEEEMAEAVDKSAPVRVQPLVAALQKVRDELTEIVAELQPADDN